MGGDRAGGDVGAIGAAGDGLFADGADRDKGLAVWETRVAGETDFWLGGSVGNIDDIVGRHQVCLWESTRRPNHLHVYMSLSLLPFVILPALLPR